MAYAALTTATRLECISNERPDPLSQESLPCIVGMHPVRSDHFGVCGQPALGDGINEHCTYGLCFVAENAGYSCNLGGGLGLSATGPITSNLAAGAAALVLAKVSRTAEARTLGDATESLLLPKNTTNSSWGLVYKAALSPKVLPLLPGWT